MFGHYGDKIGRKKLLVASLLMMGIGTFLIGLLPSFATIGIAAPAGNLLAIAVLAILAAVQSDEAFLSWGWRIPFLLSGVLVIIGL